MSSLEKFIGITREGSFNWARHQAEQFGKNIRMGSWLNKKRHIYLEGNSFYSDSCELVPLNTTMLDAVNWEVYEDDKEWNLADNTLYIGDHLKYNIKKCRDLIITKINETKYDADNKKLDIRFGLALAADIVDETFGDLK